MNFKSAPLDVAPVDRPRDWAALHCDKHNLTLWTEAAQPFCPLCDLERRSHRQLELPKDPL